MRWLLFLTFSMACLPSAGRDAEGRLGLIQYPHNARPALAQPGARLVVQLQEPAALKLLGPQGEHELAPEIAEIPGGLFEARCTVPQDCAPGLYALDAQGANGRNDRNGRAVAVVAAVQDIYTLAHVVGVPGPEVVAALNASDAEFVLLTAPDAADDEAMRHLLAVINEIGKPTYVLGTAQPLPRRYLGDVPFGFQIGRDGYLAFDARADSGRAEGTAERLRRAMMPLRWSIGITHDFNRTMNFRMQLSLFVDAPLDVVLCTAPAEEEEAAAVPWGSTRFLPTPPAASGAYRLIDVTESAILPRPMENALASAAPPAPAP